MSPPLYSVLLEDENSVFLLDLDLSSPMGFHAYPHLPILDSSIANWSLPFSISDETFRESKKLKRTMIPISSADFSISSSSSLSVSVNSIPRLNFRDHIRTYKRYLAAEELPEDTNSSESVVGAEEDGCADGMRLVQLLIACAEAVACRDKAHASMLLSELKSNALVFGSSFQRVASCFVQGLAERLTLIQPIGSGAGVSQSMMNIMDAASEEMEEAYRLVYETCPHIQFGHFVANSTILEAFEGESFVHVVDLGMSLGLPHGHQWRGLIHSLANRASGHGRVRRLRITAIGLCIARLQAIGDELSDYANNLGINLEFSVVQKNLENLQPEDIKVNDDEALVVNSILQLHCVVKESRGALNSVLQMIHGLSPKVLVMVEQDSSHNGPFFLGRFMESLHYYSAIFDSLDAMLPKYDTKRAKMEQFYFAEEIKNIVSCEGPLRMERHERVDQWRRRMSRAGFQAAPIKMVAQAKQWLLKNKICDGYTVVEEKGCLVLGWKSKPIVAASCWKC
ncbi:GRAS family protein RAD1 [Lotus japonicus]|uniref:GRAS family protein RAD1 n=1 Tax=Lotus japonicus TaxID=34305 RepID=RAD1_LOTJA|nr:GRAS family protein RAD1 [Lotus japonicus]A0A1B1WAJ0.1 RecName: Full=GRAS family protein RAD1; AltName: Full=Protein REQUIRED FOR ARBUSCULE DEVELOPMENT 1; Short=LjRAD1 [Lotus japonicus]ANW62077.1 required for arbuscule development 1 [Lotus japonicus]